MPRVPLGSVYRTQTSKMIYSSRYLLQEMIHTWNLLGFLNFGKILAQSLHNRNRGIVRSKRFYGSKNGGDNDWSLSQRQEPHGFGTKKDSLPHLVLQKII